MLHLTLPIFYIVACFFSFEFFLVVGKPLQGHVTLYPATDELESIYDMYYIKPFVVLYFFSFFWTWRHSALVYAPCRQCSFNIVGSDTPKAIASCAVGENLPFLQSDSRISFCLYSSASCSARIRTCNSHLESTTIYLVSSTSMECQHVQAHSFALVVHDARVTLRLNQFQ